MGVEQRRKMADLANEGEQWPCEETKPFDYLHYVLIIVKLLCAKNSDS